jgi:hypothetical protein
VANIGQLLRHQLEDVVERKDAEHAAASTTGGRRKRPARV